MKILEQESFNEWIGLRSRVGRHKRRKAKDLTRSTAAKRAWKMNRSRLKSTISRWHKSPPGQRFHRSLNRFNAEREKTEDYEILAPLLCASLAEHMSWLIYQSDFALYTEVYDVMEILGFISDDPEISEDIISLSSEDKVRIKIQNSNLVGYLLQEPEIGMGYQLAKVIFEDDSEVLDCLVFNAEEVEVPIVYSKKIIKEIILNKR